MRNWMLTPIIVVGLAGVGMDLINPRRAAAVDIDEQDHAVLAGAHLGLRQLGPMRPGDQEVAVAVRHHAGPQAQHLRAWLGTDADRAIAVPAQHPVTVLSVPIPTRLDRAQLWLEAEVDGQQARAAFALVS